MTWAPPKYDPKADIHTTGRCRLFGCVCNAAPLRPGERPRGEPHEFAGNEYHCAVCGSQYHCARCNRGSSMLGHSMQDDAGYFFSCEEPERAEALRRKWMEKRSK